MVRLSRIFTMHLRDTDSVARYGGDEFIVLFPETIKSESVKILKNLLDGLAVYDFLRIPGDKKLTFSAGVASYPEDGTNVSELIKSADKAPYEAKNSGRNQVRMHFHKIEEV